MSIVENNYKQFHRLTGLPRILIAAVFAFAANTAVFAQGNYEANPEKSVTIERSTDIKLESRQYEVPVEVELEYKSAGCEAKLNLEYFQRGENAQVSLTLINDQCGASYGAYTVQVRYRGGDEEMLTRDYEETWQREDAEPLQATRQYFIGDDVDLVRVKTRRLTCTCVADESAAEGDAAEEGAAESEAE